MSDAFINPVQPDCWGNYANFRVDQYVDNQLVIHGLFVGNMYNPETVLRARHEAQVLVDKINGRK